MKYFLITICAVWTTFSLANQTVFEERVVKNWGEYSIIGTGYYKASRAAGIVVFLANGNSSLNYMSEYSDTFLVTNLRFDSTLGKRGGIVYSHPNGLKTICAYKKLIGYQHTGLCKIEIQDEYTFYIVRLLVNDQSQ